MRAQKTKVYWRWKLIKSRALLTMDDALPHLHHFCATTVGPNSYVDPRPQFTFKGTDEQSITAEVTLPLSVDPSVRNATSAGTWKTERMARKDAALQAYKALHMAGLVNDNLLPQREAASDEVASFQIADITPSLVNVSSPFDPWLTVAKCQHENAKLHDLKFYNRVLLKLKDGETIRLHMVLLMPCPMPDIQKIVLHWNEIKDFSVETSALPEILLNGKELMALRRITWKILCSVLHGKWTQEPRDDFLWLLAPTDPEGNPLDTNALEEWDTNTEGQIPALEVLRHQMQAGSNWGQINIQGDGRKFVLGSVTNEATPSIKKEEDETYLQVIRMPKRRDFLHKIPPENKGSEAYSRLELLNADQCVVDRLPAIYSIFALFVPSIIHKYELFFTAGNLRTTILRPLEFQPSDTSLIIRAMTSSKTAEKQDYQRLEFLGDCILKLIASVHLMAAHPLSPESYLTGKKGKIICNGFLARATMAACLDRFIITNRFTGKSWAPRFAKDVLKTAIPEDKKEDNAAVLCSSKLLADVVESLIGASYITGGFPKAFTCIRTLLPLEDWTPLPTANDTLFSNAPDDFTPSNLSTLERLIGHSFTKKFLMLEALTHGSYTGPLTSVRSYERLEFLGDAILDYIISTRLYSHDPPLSHKTMHGIRTAMANAAFLAFRMCETTVDEQITNPATLKQESVSRALWQYLRYSNTGLSPMSEVRDRALAQHNAERAGILAALENDDRYPWHLLARMDAAKFLSDIVESVIGAVYVDSMGDLAACERVVGRLGILDALEGVLRRGVDCLHPKERVAILAVEKSVEYVKVDDYGEESEEEGEGAEEEVKGYRCQVRVGGVNVGGPVSGLKKLNAETIAAWRAVQILEGRKRMEVMAGLGEEEEEEEDEEMEVWHDAEEGL